MKRIVDGVTYNTDTSTKIATWEWDNTRQGGTRGEAVLYQTLGGAFFEAVTEIVTYKDRWEELAEREKTEVQPMTREAAQKWILEGDIEVFSDDLGEPPEATASEPASAATIYVRLPKALKERIEKRAEKEGLSLNSFAIRCFEQCSSTPRKNPQVPLKQQDAAAKRKRSV